MNEAVIVAYKNEGETPLETIRRIRRDKNISKDIPMTYAGRLDPMAEGVLIMLTGEECKKKDEYLGLDKQYEVEILLGINSDTGDILGKISGVKDFSNVGKDKDKILQKIFSEKDIKNGLRLLIGKREEKYPMFSSKPVNGKPLFMHAREGGIEDAIVIELPQKEIEIYSVDYLEQEEVTLKVLIETVINRISKVSGDFRQKEIINLWNSMLHEHGKIKEKTVFQIIKVKVSSSSGAYMRTLAEKFGKSLGVPALAWRIKRISVGDYRIS